MKVYRDYTDEPIGVAAVPPKPPELGAGTVFIGEQPDGSWFAAWQDEDRFDDIEGDRDQVLGWATSRNAVSVQIFNPTKDKYEDLA